MYGFIFKKRPELILQSLRNIVERKAHALSKWMVQNRSLNRVFSWLPTGGLYVVTAALGPVSQEWFHPGMDPQPYCSPESWIGNTSCNRHHQSYCGAVYWRLCQVCWQQLFVIFTYSEMTLSLATRIASCCKAEKPTFLDCMAAKWMFTSGNISHLRVTH